jgi:beta-lactamase class A
LVTLDADFAQLRQKVHGVVGIAISAVGADQNPRVLRDWSPGPAWSTIKVPLAIAALREANPPEVTQTMTAAITDSDNAAAESLWASLGDPTVAAQKVEKVLREAGDETKVQSQKVRPPFTAFGQTIWSLTEQAKFISLRSAIVEIKRFSI